MNQVVLLWIKRCFWKQPFLNCVWWSKNSCSFKPAGSLFAVGFVERKVLEEHIEDVHWDMHKPNKKGGAIHVIEKIASFYTPLFLPVVSSWRRGINFNVLTAHAHLLSEDRNRVIDMYSLFLLKLHRTHDILLRLTRCLFKATNPLGTQSVARHRHLCTLHLLYWP